MNTKIELSPEDISFLKMVLWNTLCGTSLECKDLSGRPVINYPCSSHAQQLNEMYKKLSGEDCEVYLKLYTTQSK